MGPAPDPAPAATAPAAPTAGDAASPPTPDAAELADDETTSRPEFASDRRVAYLDAAAPWSAGIGAFAGGTRLEPALLARINLLYDDTAAELRHEAEWEAVIHPLAGTAAAIDDLTEVDYDDRDLRDGPPEGARYVLTDAKLNTKTYFTKAQSALKDHLYRSETLELLQNKELGVYSRVGESREDFERRCFDVAGDRADADADKIRQALDKKMDRVKDAIVKAQDKVREVEADASGKGRDAMLSGALDVLGGLLGGRKSTRSILGGVRRASSKGRQ